MKLARALGAMALAGAVAPAVQAAEINGPASIICLVSGGLNSCASVQISVTGSVLTATVTNLDSEADYLLPSLGFFYTGTNTTGVTALTLDPLSQTDGGNTWVNGLNFGLAEPGPTGGTFLGGASAAGPDDRLATGETIQLNFAISGEFTSDAEIFFAFRGQEWMGGDSFKCYEGAPNSTPSGAVCEPPTDVVPEPATMLLLATGLIGLGGASLLRRRNRS